MSDRRARAAARRPAMSAFLRDQGLHTSGNLCNDIHRAYSYGMISHDVFNEMNANRLYDNAAIHARPGANGSAPMRWSPNSN